MGALGPGRRGLAAWGGAGLAALVISRWVVFPRYLITFDEINFALSISHFNPSLHQPQPPGYPVFVALLKLISTLIPKVEPVFLVSGLLVSAAALVLIWWLGAVMARRKVGLVAAGLMLFNPAFWLSALTNPVRICFAAGAEAVALCAYLACRRKSWRWFVAAASVLGLAAGARPALAILMAPLLLWVAFRIHLPWRFAAIAVVCCCATVATWLPVTITAVGGIADFYRMLGGYSQAQMGGTSILFGASWGSALQMAWQAIAWTCLGALSWAWALALAGRKISGAFDPLTRRFFALWFIPGLVFYATFHVGDPDHTLSIIPVTCIAGAIVLVSATAGYSSRKRAAVIGCSILLNVFLFFKPITKTTKASTYAPVRWLDGYMTGVLEGVADLSKNSPVTVVFPEETTGWRNLSYYEPEVHIVVIMNRPGGPVTTWNIYRKQVTEKKGPGALILPSCAMLAWVDPVAGPIAPGGTPIRSTHPRVFYAQAAPGESFDFHGIRFTTGPCTQKAD